MKMTEEQRKLAEDNHNLIYGFLTHKNLDDDFYDLASIGLCRAAINYKDDKVKFSTFAYACMNNEIRSYLVNIEGAKKRVPKELVSSYDIELDEGESILDTYIGNNECIIEETLLRIDYDNFKKLLKEKELVIVEYFESGLSQTEISKMLGKTQQCISLIKKDIICKWNEFYNRS